MYRMCCSMKSARRARHSLLVACCLSFAGVLSPAASAAEPGDEDREQAQALFDAGLERKAAGQGAAACEAFETSVALAGTPHGWLQVGLCREPLDPVAAISAFEAALAAAREVSDGSRRQAYEGAARERLERLAARVPTITFRRSPTAGVSVDVTAPGREAGLPVADFDEPVRFNPGRYRVRAWARGHLSYAVDLELGEGQRHVVALPELAPAPVASAADGHVGASGTEASSVLPASSGEASEGELPFAPEHVAPAARGRSESRFGAWPLALVGSGAALVALGIGSGQLSSSARNDLRRACEAPAAGGRRRCGSELAGTKRRLERYALAADVLWIGGTLLAGTGITLFVLDRDPGESKEVVAGCFPGGCGLSAAGRF
jgi:hypothetical protein